MGYCEDAKALVGRVSLFVGVESYNWTVQEFQQAAQTARSIGVDTLIVKVADGAYRWYGGNWQAIHDAIKSQGVGCLFYAYGYGDKYGAFQAELDILKLLLHSFGVACADLEVEWNGRVDLAKTMAGQLAGQPGVLYITTWANPSGQNWMQVAHILGPVVRCWLPQAYDDYLYGVMRRDYATLGCYVPTLDITSEYGTNGVLALAKACIPDGAVSLWEYGPASASPLTKQVVQMLASAPAPTTTPPTGGSSMTQLTFTAQDMLLWQRIDTITINPPAAIEQSWLRALAQGRYFGPPLENEHTVSVGGKNYIQQAFSGALAMYDIATGSLTWHTPAGPVQV